MEAYYYEAYYLQLNDSASLGYCGLGLDGAGHDGWVCPSTGEQCSGVSLNDRWSRRDFSASLSSAAYLNKYNQEIKSLLNLSEK